VACSLPMAMLNVTQVRRGKGAHMYGASSFYKTRVQAESIATMGQGTGEYSRMLCQKRVTRN
jgi:hypothetical protein